MKLATVLSAALVAAMLAGGILLAATAPSAPAAPPATKSAAPAATKSAAPAKKPDPPAAGRTIKGHLTPPDRVVDAYLWERAQERIVPVKVDPKTGAFEAAGLGLGTWDFVIRTPWGRLEGVDMAPKMSDYDALIPPEYRTADLGAAAGGSLTEDDQKAIHHIIYDVKRYENKVRDMYLVGSATKAVALMDLMMDADFVGRKGDEVTWRIEQWYYDKNYGAWTTFRTRVLYRFRVSKAVLTTWGWQFEPALGGFNISEDRREPVTVEFTIPEKPVVEKGLTGNKIPPVEQGRVKEVAPAGE
jgi:hypothetical protein